ncbi:unnamed protein product [Nesidiocoris tenuis]|uniref:Uncharacterized protein n=1 Tax=Nesidiocoris tenuis TaxID=355587 RepID=A0A6H5HCW4_9HEMI|nr:unnamed protein product [Nesidiocoris tenuis]
MNSIFLHNSPDNQIINHLSNSRTVDYTADPINGFNANVRKEAGAAPAIAVARYAPVAVAHAPVAVAHAPVAVAHAPVAVAHAPVAVAHAPAYYTSSFASPAVNYHF